MALFGIGEFYPPVAHEGRIERYRHNKKIFKGEHYAAFEEIYKHVTGNKRDIVYISANFGGLICKKSADFLFGENPTFTAGKEADSNEQKAIERIVRDNELNITNYESAMANAYRGDSFYKIRWGQRYGGVVPKDIDPFRVHIESQNPEFVFPEVSMTDANTTIAYHIAYPVMVEGKDGEDWILNVESHYAGFIRYKQYRMRVISYNVHNEVESWKIYAEIEDSERIVETDVPFPLIVHVPNFATDDDVFGIDDITEHRAIFDEINNRLSQIAKILDKHADPAIAVPSGSLQEDENGNPVFHVARDKVFEVMDKSEVIPQYITWNGQLDAAYKELEKLIDLLLTTAEIPPVALGKDNSGTSGASGLSIKWRMNSLLSKINRKRQYYEKGLKRVLLIAQLLEHARSARKPDYKVTEPKIIFKDGLPDDDMEQATIAQIRTNAKPTQSQLSAIMEIHDMTEEQARIELERIKEEEQTADPSIFNSEDGGDN